MAIQTSIDNNSQSLTTQTFVSAGTTVTAGTGLVATTGGITATGNSIIQAGTITLASGTNEIDISADAANTTVKLGTGAGVKTVTLGSTNTTSITNLQAGSGGINIPAFTEGALITSSVGLVTTITGTAGKVLTANAAGTAPSFQSLPASSITITGNSGGGLTGSSFTFTGGTTGLTFAGAGSTETLGGTLVVSNGGTGNATLTANAVLLGNGTSATADTGVGTDGQVLLGDTASNPNWVTPTGGTGLTVTANDTTLSWGITAPVSIANGGTNATSMVTTDGVVYYDGTRLVTTAVGSSTQVLTSNGAGVAPTFQAAASGGITFSVITADQTAAINNGYICNKAGLLTLTLPSTAAAGTQVEVTGMNTALGWKIAQGNGQQIHFGTSNTTSGAGGSLASVNIYDSVRLVCSVANNEWIVLSSIGNITVV